MPSPCDNRKPKAEAEVKTGSRRLLTGFPPESARLDPSGAQLVTFGARDALVKLWKPRPDVSVRNKREKRTMKRGKVTSYSPAVRRRLTLEIGGLCWRALLLDLSQPCPPLFITLTAPGDGSKGGTPSGWSVERTNEEVVRAFRAWLMWLGRNYPNAWGWWVREYTQRGYMHFHILLKMPDWSPRTRKYQTFKEDSEAAWVRAVGAPKGSHNAAQNVKVVKAEGIGLYLAKELSKYEQKGVAPTGLRSWVGRINLKAIKANYYEERTSLSVHDKALHELALFLRFQKITRGKITPEDRWRIPRDWPAHESYEGWIREAKSFLEGARPLKKAA